MILQALVSYYEALYAQRKIYPQGYCITGVSYGLRIGWDGELASIIPLKETIMHGKREKVVEVPKDMVVPNKEDRQSNILPHFLCDHSGYLLGIDDKGKPKRTEEYFAASKELHCSILKDVDSLSAKAIVRFFCQWKMEDASSHSILQKYHAMITAPATNLIFILPDGTYAHNEAAIQDAWEKHLKNNESKVRMACLVTGKGNQPIARLHGKIKGYVGDQGLGGSIVSFNEDAYESYGKEMKRKTGQGLNSPVSEYAAFAYVAALNYLLSNSKHKQEIGDATVVYWAETGEHQYVDMFTDMMFPDETAQERLHGIMERLANGIPIEGTVNLETKFYVLALSPNAARLSIRFFWQGKFGDMVDNLKTHYKRLEIEKAPYEKKYLGLDRLLEQTVPPNAQNQAASPLLSGRVMQSVLMKMPYPAMLAQTVLLRIRIEQKVGWEKAAILRAWLLSGEDKEADFEEYKEALTVGRNVDTKIKPYVLGRMLAVLEETQERTSDTDIKATIRSRFFASACATPGAVFQTLLRLNNFHLIKIARLRGENTAAWYAKRLRELLDKLEVEDNPFPTRFDSKQQCLFALGYHQEVQARYQKKAAAANGEAKDIMDDEINATKEEE